MTRLAVAFVMTVACALLVLPEWGSRDVSLAYSGTSPMQDQECIGSFANEYSTYICCNTATASKKANPPGADCADCTFQVDVTVAGSCWWTTSLTWRIGATQGPNTVKFIDINVECGETKTISVYTTGAGSGPPGSGCEFYHLDLDCSECE
jgi:hypothetical protein